MSGKSETEKVQHDAFISYAHEDQRTALALQRFLESYPAPASDRKRGRLRVYLDKTDIRSGELGDELRSALRSAAALLVCCSKACARSAWVDREITAFQEQSQEGGTQRPVVAVLVDDERSDAIPARLKDRDLLVADVRDGRMLGIWRRAARIELLRVLAKLCDQDLRKFIPWDRRRRRRRRVLVAGIIGLVFVAASFTPLQEWRKLELDMKLRQGNQVIAGEVLDKDLVVAVRFVGEGDQGTRDYVELHRPLTRSGDFQWLENNYSPRRRLMPWIAAHAELQDKATRAIRMNVSRWEDVWVGEPVSGTLVVVQRLRVDDEQQPQDRFDPPVTGRSAVFVHTDGRAQRAEVAGLWPDPLGLKGRSPVTNRSASPMDGLPLAWGQTGLWIGCPARTDDLAPAGLWHSKDQGKTWHKQHGLVSVGSVLLMPGRPEQVVVAEASRRVRIGLESRVFASRIMKLTPQGTWSDFNGPSFGESSEIELSGLLPGVGMVIRIDQSFWVKASVPLYSRLFW